MVVRRFAHFFDTPHPPAEQDRDQPSAFVLRQFEQFGGERVEVGCFHFSKTVFRFLPRGVPKKQKAIFPFFPAFLVQNAVFWRPKTQNTKKQNKRGKNLGAECILHSVFCILI